MLGCMSRARLGEDTLIVSQQSSAFGHRVWEGIFLKGNGGDVDDVDGGGGGNPGGGTLLVSCKCGITDRIQNQCTRYILGESYKRTEILFWCYDIFGIKHTSKYTLSDINTMQYQIFFCQTPVLGQVFSSRLRLGVDFTFAW